MLKPNDWPIIDIQRSSLAGGRAAASASNAVKPAGVNQQYGRREPGDRDSVSRPAICTRWPRRRQVTVPSAKAEQAIAGRLGKAADQLARAARSQHELMRRPHTVVGRRQHIGDVEGPRCLRNASHQNAAGLDARPGRRLRRLHRPRGRETRTDQASGPSISTTVTGGMVWSIHVGPDRQALRDRSAVARCPRQRRVLHAQDGLGHWRREHRDARIRHHHGWRAAPLPDRLPDESLAGAEHEGLKIIIRPVCMHRPPPSDPAYSDSGSDLPRSAARVGRVAKGCFQNARQVRCRGASRPEGFTHAEKRRRVDDGPGFSRQVFFRGSQDRARSQ